MNSLADFFKSSPRKQRAARRRAAAVTRTRSPQTASATKSRAAKRRAVIRRQMRDALIEKSARLMKPLIYGAIAAVVATLPLAGYRVFLHVMASPHFTLSKVEITGTRVLSEADIIAASGLVLGRSTMDFEPAKVQAGIQSLSWVKDVQVHRRLPDGYSIVVTERKPVAVLAWGDLHLVDDTALPFVQIPTQDLPRDLPVISVNGVERLGLDDFNQIYLREMIAEAITLSQEYRNLNLDNRYRLNEVSIDPIEGYRLYVGEDDACFVLGMGPFDDKWNRLRVVLQDLESRQARVEMIRLDLESEPWKVAVKAANLDIKAREAGPATFISDETMELLP